MTARFPLSLLAVLALATAVAPGVAEDPLARALVEQRQRAERAPFDPTVQNDFGNLLALAGETEAAEAAYRRALEADPDFATAHYNLGRLLSRQGHLWAARRELKSALAIEPDSADALYHLGVVYAGWGFDRLARRAYARAFRLDPSLANPHRNPHVLENRLALAAQLMAWEAERAPGPTRQYEDAESIATQARLAASSSSAPAPDEPAPAAAEEAPGPSEGGSPQIVLGASDLRGSGKLNQVRPGAGERGRRSTIEGREPASSPARFRPGRDPANPTETTPDSADPSQRAIDS